MSANTILVANSAELTAALKVAKGGDTILLQNGGSKYSLSTYPSVSFDKTVTITSADPANPAVFHTLSLKNASNLHFDNLVFNSDVEGQTRSENLSDINVSSSSHISITNSAMKGTAQGIFGTEGVEKAESAIVVRGVDNFIFSGNTIANYNHGITLWSVKNAAISGNEITQMQGDGMRLVEVKDVLIDKNYFHDFIGSTNLANHGDMIQLWSTNAKSPTENLVIRGNVLDGGNGTGTQSIFMRNELVDTGQVGKEMYYKNFLIEDNVIYNGHTHGITVGEVDGIIVRNNTLLFNPESPMRDDVGNPGVASAPGISIKNVSTNVTVENNITSSINVPVGSVVTENLIVTLKDKSSENYVGNLFVIADIGGSVGGMSGLQALPGGLIEKLGVGSSMTRFDMHPEKLTALYTVETVKGQENLLSFDASLTAAKNGFAGAKATYLWDFGDGSTATGMKVTHEFSTYDRQNVTLKVVLDGEVDIFAASPVTQNPLLMDIDFNGGIVDKSDYASQVIANAASLVSNGEGQAYRLSNTAPIELTRGNAQLFNLDQMGITFDFKRTMAANDSGQIFNLMKSFNLTLKTDGTLVFALTDSDAKAVSLTASKAIIDDQWHKIGISYDTIGGSAVLYVDGVAVAHSDATGITLPPQSWSLTLGTYIWGDSADGYVDDLKIVSDPLSPTGEIIVHPPAVEPPVVPFVLYNDTPPSPASKYDTYFTGTDGVDRGQREKHLDNFMNLQGGDDTVDAGAGNDYVLGGYGDDWIFGNKGYDIVIGGHGNDYIRAAEKAYGGEGDDKLFADTTDGASLYGGVGNDALTGYFGNDFLVGGAGADTMRGGQGNDVLVADGEDVFLQGGAGYDKILYEGAGEYDLGSTAKVYGVEEFDMTNGVNNKLYIDWRDVFQSDDDILFVFGDSSDSVVLEEGGKFKDMGKVEMNGQEFAHYNAHSGSWLDVDLYVSVNVSVTTV